MPQVLTYTLETVEDTSTILRVVFFTATGTVKIGGLVLCDATGGAFTVNLPPASNLDGRQLVFKKTDASANAVTIDGDGSETIDGLTTRSLASQYDSITIVSDETNDVWHII